MWVLERCKSLDIIFVIVHVLNVCFFISKRFIQFCLGHPSFIGKGASQQMSGCFRTLQHRQLGQNSYDQSLFSSFENNLRFPLFTKQLEEKSSRESPLHVAHSLSVTWRARNLSRFSRKFRICNKVWSKSFGVNNMLQTFLTVFFLEICMNPSLLPMHCTAYQNVLIWRNFRSTRLPYLTSARRSTTLRF